MVISFVDDSVGTFTDLLCKAESCITFFLLFGQDLSFTLILRLYFLNLAVRTWPVVVVGITRTFSLLMVVLMME